MREIATLLERFVPGAFDGKTVVSKYGGGGDLTEPALKRSSQRDVVL